VLSLLAFVVLVGVLITAHEFGHYVVAKLSGVKVLTFCIGFGPSIVARTIGETEYRVAWLPIGGYVRMLGHFPEDATADDEGRSLLDKPPLIRILIAAAGPAMNLLLPFLILFPVIGLSAHFDEVIDSQVGAVDQSLPAGRQGLREGDRIVAIDGDAVQTFWQVAQHVDDYSAGQGPLHISVERPGQEARVDLEITPRAVEENLLGFTTTNFRIGIQPVFLRSDIAITDPSGPLARAGVRTFDRISKVGGRETPRYIDAETALRAVAPGARIPVEVVRAATLRPDLPFLRTRETSTVEYLGPADQDPKIRHAGACVTSVDPTGPSKDTLRPGDCILAVGGERNTLGLFVYNRLTSRPEAERELTILRGGAELEVSLKQEEVKQDDPFHGELTAWKLGFTLLDAPGGHMRSDGVVQNEPVTNPARGAHAWYETNRRVWQGVEIILRFLSGIAAGDVSVSHLSGPLGIARVAGEQARRGVVAYLGLMVMLSLNLALINLLPVPVLDGGQMMVAFLELVMRRPLSDRFLNALQVAGVLMVLALFALAMGNDLLRELRVFLAAR